MSRDDDQRSHAELVAEVARLRKRLTETMAALERMCERLGDLMRLTVTKNGNGRGTH